MDKKKQEKCQEELRKLSLLPENRICMECQIKSTPNVVIDYGIFVCSFCAGLHRKYQAKVKGIAMTNFTQEQVDFFKNNGNKIGHLKWRAKWNEHVDPRPKPNDSINLDIFISDTYVKKKIF